MIIKMPTKLGRRMDKYSENLKIENIRKFQTEVTELKNTITEWKNNQWGSKADLMK